MNATKILWGQVLLVSGVVLAFVWAATEWTAWKLGFQSQLGHPWFDLLGWPVYQPPAFFWWWFAYDAYARPIFVEGAYIAASGGIAAVIVAVAQTWQARPLDGRDMNKDVGAAVLRRDKAKSLGVIEELHCTPGHAPRPVIEPDLFYRQSGPAETARATIPAKSTAAPCDRTRRVPPHTAAASRRLPICMDS